MAFPLIPLIGPIISGVTSFFTKKQEIKKARVTAEGKLAMRKETGDQNIELVDAEWEALSIKSNDGSWKDEFVTVTILAPIPAILIGAVWNAFTGNDKLLTGTLAGVEKLTALGLDWNMLTTAVVLAAIGLKVWRNK
jgi:hypothetical protein